MTKELINKLEGLKAAEEIANRAEARWEQEPENELLEKRFDRAYTVEFKCYMECVRLVQIISGGKIDFETAKKLVQTKRSELVKLLNKTA